MAIGRIGVTPTLRTRWSKAPAGGTTSLSGLDDNSVSLVYDVGYEAVYRNGVLLSRTNDYTATTGNSITLVDATIAGDIIEVFANQLLPLTNAIGNGQYTAKGALLSATAASTPAVLTVGSNDQVLTADSTTATGLKWAAPSAGGMTLISTTTLSGASTTLSSIPQTYNDLFLLVTGITNNTFDAIYRIAPNGDTTNVFVRFDDTTISNTTADRILLTRTGAALRTNANNAWGITFSNYTSTTTRKPFHIYGGYVNSSSNNQPWFVSGMYNSNSAISSIVFSPDTQTFAGGTVLLYGVK